MSGTANVIENSGIQLCVPITKIDKEQRLVTGIATAEVIDKAGDIVDYATAKKFFQDPTLWPGNMREMHQPKAVGKAVSVDFDDDNKTIMLTSKVSKGAPDTWEKILDGTLSMYSIGGSGDRHAEKVGDRFANRIFLKALAEVSYVDNGANPLAKFDVVKSAFADDPTEEVVIVEPNDVIKFLRSRVKHAKPLDLKAEVIEKVEALGDEFKAKLPASWRGEALDEKVTKIYSYGSVKKAGPEPWDIDRALLILSALNDLASSEYWDAYYSQDPDSEEVAQIDLLKKAAGLIFQFLQSEFQEQFAPSEQQAPMMEVGDMVSMADAAINVLKAGKRHSKVDQTHVQGVHDSSVALGATCGDVKKVEELPKTEEIVEKVAEDKVVETKVVETIEEVVKPIEKLVPAEDVQKLTSALESANSLIKEQGDQLATLKKEVEDIKKKAVPGGPMARIVTGTPVRKSAGNEPAGDESTSPEAVVTALEMLAKEGSDDVRKAAATAMAKLVHGGAGRIDFSIK
jgi:hypothetical protein